MSHSHSQRLSEEGWARLLHGIAASALCRLAKWDAGTLNWHQPFLQAHALDSSLRVTNKCKFPAGRPQQPSWPTAPLPLGTWPVPYTPPWGSPKPHPFCLNWPVSPSPGIPKHSTTDVIKIHVQGDPTPSVSAFCFDLPMRPLEVCWVLPPGPAGNKLYFSFPCG